jgi:hypothetical protein
MWRVRKLCGTAFWGGSATTQRTGKETSLISWRKSDWNYWSQFFLDDVMDHPHVAENDECASAPAWFGKDTAKRRRNSHSKVSPTTYPHEILFAIRGWRGKIPMNYIQTYETRRPMGSDRKGWPDRAANIPWHGNDWFHHFSDRGSKRNGLFQLLQLLRTL